MSQPEPGQRAGACADAPAADDLLTVTQAARDSGLSRSTIRGWIRGGKLPSRRIARRCHVQPADLAAAQKRHHLGAVLPTWRAHPRRGGKRLRALREAAGLSQGQLATASGLTHEAISRLETGHRSPHATTVRLLAQALGVLPERSVDREPLGLSTLSAAEVAARLDLPLERVQTWLQRGELAGRKVSGRWHVPALAVRELARSGQLRGQSRRLDPRYRG